MQRLYGKMTKPNYFYDNVAVINKSLKNVVLDKSINIGVANAPAYGFFLQ